MNLFKFQWPSRILHNTYELLPTNSQPDGGIAEHDTTPNIRRRRASRRCGLSYRSIASSLIMLLVLLIFYKFWTRHSQYSFNTQDPESVPPPVLPPSIPDHAAAHEDTAAPPRPPPLYEEYRERERKLPQHNLSLPYPEGTHAKFLWAANHGSGFGWGNYMEEIILDAYLAYSAHRAYVFDNYTWQREGPEISDWNGKPIPARIPLSVFLSGPIIGGSTHNKDVPRAVSREYFFSVCPESERVVLDTRTIQDTLSQDATVSQIVERWVRELNSIESPCVELARNSPALFSYSITNTMRVLDVFPALSQSPILSNFGWSALILEGFNDNLNYFVHPSEYDSLSPLETYITPLKGLIAVHVRRGDYETWCHNAYANRMSFTGFNSFPSLPDKYTPPRPGSKGDEDRTRKHCLPSISEIVDKVLSVTQPHIKRVYVMTNAPRPWLSDLKLALNTAHHWSEGVGTSRDLELSWEGKFVAEAVDMHVGQRAEKFIGNGFSSLTSNIVLLRMHNPDLNPSDTYFW